MFRKVCLVGVVLAITSLCPQAESSAVQKESRFFWLRPGFFVPLPNVPIPRPPPAGGSTATTCAKKSECIAAGKDKCSTVDKNMCGADATKAGTDKPTDCYVQAASCTPPAGVTKACGPALCPA